jgi:Tfp pilus assembly protein PilX
VALLITVLILLVVSILGAAVVNLGRIDYALSGNYRASTASLSLADSALHATVADLRGDYDADPANSALAAWVNLGGSPPTIVTPFPDPTGAMVNGFVLAPATVSPDPYSGTPYSLGSAQTLGSGSYSRTIWLPPTISTDNGVTSVRFRVRAEGTDSNPATPATTVIDGVVNIDLSTAGGYSTGMLLGAGDNGEVVSGGIVQIAGSVVVLGESGSGGGSGSRGRGRGGGRGRGRGGGTPSSELNFSNFSGMVNSYAGIGDATALGGLATKVPALQTQEYNGDTVSALDTALYLSDTELSLASSAALGAADVPGNGYKETLDGIYSDDTVDTGGGNIHADEIGAWNLGNVTFPSLSDSYTDSVSGSSYGSYSAYLNTIAYAPFGGADLEIDQGTASFSYTDPGGNGSISWDAGSGLLTVSGIIRINGDVVLGDGNGGLGAVKYAGSGILWAQDDIRVYDDLYPDGQYLQDGPDADSSIDGNLGLMTANEIRLDAGAASGNLQVFATLFAEGQLDVRSRTNIAGSVITNHIDISGFNRLNVWYVPGLAAGAPAGMPGGGGVPTIGVRMSDWFQLR